MKTEAAIRHKLRQVLFRHLKHQIESNFERLPHTCGFNGSPKFSDLPRICLWGAGNPLTWAGKICDADVDDGVQQAKTCPYWTPIRTKEEIKAEFKAVISKNRVAVAAQFPDAAALMWVLEEETLAEVFSEIEEAEQTLVQLPTKEPSP